MNLADIKKSRDGVQLEILKRQDALLRKYNHLKVKDTSWGHRIITLNNAGRISREIIRLEKIKNDMDSIIKNTTIMTTTTIDRPLTTQELYDVIGQLNMEIVPMEVKILDLEDQVHLFPDEPDHEMAVREALHENRKAVRDLNEQVKKHRLTIISRHEITLDGLGRVMQNAPGWREAESAKDLLTKELDVLRKLVAA